MQCLVLLGLLSGLTTAHARYEQMRLDDVLSNWERHSKSLRCLSIESEMTIKEGVFDKEESRAYLFKYRRLENGRFATFIARQSILSSNGKESQKSWTPFLLYDGKTLWEFNDKDKIIYGYPCEGKMPRIFLWFSLPDDFLYYPFFFYLRCNPNELHQRFDVTVIREDQHRVWIRAIPNNLDEQKDFEIALVGMLNNKGYSVPQYFPQIIKWRDIVKRETTCIVKHVSRNNEETVQESDFNIDSHATGWKIEKRK